jgi:cyclopropane fatty-acyl-phospholipid synthase-like methyltransferase
MNNTINEPAYPADRFLGKIQGLSEIQLLIAAISLDVFTYLEKRVSSTELANNRKWHIRNTELLLNALTASEYIIKENNQYVNLPDTNYYLNKNSDMYIGEYIQFWYEIKKIDNIETLVKNGPTFGSFSDKNGSDSYDFYRMAKVARVEMYTGRVQAFIKFIQTVFPLDSQINALDIGGGSGVLSIELVRNFKNARSIVFDQPEVIKLTEEIIKEYEVDNKVGTLSGNFISDDFGYGYNLIIASAIFDFVGNLDKMAEKIYQSMTAGGFMYVDTHMVNDDFTSPKNCIIGWLSSHLDGLNILKSDSEITSAIERAGFVKYMDGKEYGFTGYIYKKP